MLGRILDRVFGKKKWIVRGPFLDEGVFNRWGVYDSEKRAFKRAHALNWKFGCVIFDVVHSRVGFE